MPLLQKRAIFSRAILMVDIFGHNSSYADQLGCFLKQVYLHNRKFLKSKLNLECTRLIMALMESLISMDEQGAKVIVLRFLKMK